MENLAEKKQRTSDLVWHFGSYRHPAGDVLCILVEPGKVIKIKAKIKVSSESTSDLINRFYHTTFPTFIPFRS